MADSYDWFIRRAVPRYDEMVDRLVEHLPTTASRILELGCGTGNVTLRLIARYPGAQITIVDAAPEMIELTSRRAASRGTAGLKAVSALFEDADLPAASFDLVASSMSLHHVRDKASLYRGIRGWLAPGGSLRFADMFLGATEETQREFWDRWIEFCRRPGHCTEEELKGLIDHAAAHDHYVPLAEHFRMLSEAGFRNIDCVWRNYMYAVVIADRP